MNIKHWILLGLVVVASLTIGQATTAPGPLQIAQAPLFADTALPPLNMLVMGKDHKIYYEAYNDASDLDGDGGLDIGYQGWQTKENGQAGFKIDYFGYFNSYACYTWDGNKFNPVSTAPNKTCSGQWSGDFLNYLTTSRMDALRRVLYGGWRHVDTASETVLQGAFFPQDGHSWGKEYQSTERDGYDITKYAPLSQPLNGRYHLFAVTTVTDNSAPLFRVLQNTPYRVWNWLSIETPVAGNKCFTGANKKVDCVSPGTSAPVYPPDRASFDAMESTWAKPEYFFGSTGLTTINCQDASCNPNGSQKNSYLSIITGSINVLSADRYQFRVNGDDAIDFQLVVGNTVVQAGCYGARTFASACQGGAQQTDVVNLSKSSYSFKFRHMDKDGNDGYRLEARTCNGQACNNAGPWKVITSSGADVSLSNVSIATYDTVAVLGGASRVDYRVRVSVCPGSEVLRDSSCKAYPNGKFKPTGILHDYGESERMYFGLITGSQENNLEGGKLRRNVGNFKDEIDATTGQFRSDVVGIARTIDRLRMIGGAYEDGTLNNLNSDSGWSWSGGYGNCPLPIGGLELANGQCRMWGNPIAEMMYESLRYFAGAAAATTRFATGGSSAGVAEESAMELPTAAWKDPYKSTAGGGLGFPVCARPYQTVISDINPSYDGDLPGSAFLSTPPINDVPSLIGFNAKGQGDIIWNHEFFGGTKKVFIGEVGGATDGAPTAKMASSFGNIRGLSPEEPTKNGTYYAASVARFGRITDINPAQGAQNLSTYTVALASPLPHIEFPVGGRTVTLMPFAKTVSGFFGEGTRKHTNTIVDFYVERIRNLPGQDSDTDVNGGRPYAVFRINYEDVEHGNDHDMDAITRYEVAANADGTLNVNLTSEYANGIANQNMGYVISGTTQDGVYLEVRDRDSEAASSLYMLNTPPGAWAGDCLGGTTTAPCNQPLGFAASRKFSAAPAGSATAIQLKDPLWYAAKYGGFVESTNGNNLPDGAEWDSNSDGTPDNYFLVTNPLNLRSQLTAAFDSIKQQDGNSGTLSISSARVGADSFVVLPSYNSLAGGHDWTG
ncbi:MAG TPA: hypothetical protein VEY92_10450, partial [Pseudoxanthomonas sp.]|nr:hypothetical protein [Pseudoxanthomonas sp.]